MKKIVGLTIAVLLIVGLVGAGTYAYFSDTESSTNNTLTAGTLDLNIDGGNVAVTTFTASGVAPGDSGSGSSTLANVGSISGELDIATSAVTNTPGAGGTEYEGGSGELGASTQIAVYLDVDQSGGWNAGDIGLQSNGATYSFPTALNYDEINDYASETWNAVETMVTSAADDIFVNWQVPVGAVNDIQGDSVSFDITFTLEQPAAD
jgi:predicted ribosomally synthesized peptide with SipW-like signal peptide